MEEAVEGRNKTQAGDCTREIEHTRKRYDYDQSNNKHELQAVLKIEDARMLPDHF